MRHRPNPEVVYVERGGDSSVKWLLWGLLLGAGVALLYAPRSGEETRRSLQRRLRQLRATCEEKLDELAQQFGGARNGSLEDLEDAIAEDEPLGVRSEPPRTASARQELERRLSDARRRRAAGDRELEEPQA
jgi:gas vesicle protein